MAALYTRHSLWTLAVVAVIAQFVGGVLLGFGLAEESLAYLFAGWTALGAGSAMMLVALVAFGVVLGSHVYRHERP